MLAAVDSGAVQPQLPRIPGPPGATCPPDPSRARPRRHDFVGETDDGANFLNFRPNNSELSAQIDQRRQPGGADRDAGGSLAPWNRPKLSFMTVPRYRSRSSVASPRRSACALRSGFSCSGSEAVGAVRRPYVRLIHPGPFAMVKPSLCSTISTTRRARATRTELHDRTGLTRPRVLADIRRKRDGHAEEFDRREVDDAALGLRDDFLRNDEAHLPRARGRTPVQPEEADAISSVRSRRRPAPIRGTRARQGNDLQRSPLRPWTFRPARRSGCAGEAERAPRIAGEMNSAAPDQGPAHERDQSPESRDRRIRQSSRHALPDRSRN